MLMANVEVVFYRVLGPSSGLVEQMHEQGLFQMQFTSMRPRIVIQTDSGSRSYSTTPIPLCYV